MIVSQRYTLLFMMFLALAASNPSQAQVLASTPNLIVNSQATGIKYAYGPSIVYENGIYRAFFCSHGTSSVDWDHVRSVYSYDMVHWSYPVTVLTSIPVERANCDPSVVKWNSGDGDYYYMFYSGNVVNVQTVNYVARATSLEGPFLKLTDRGTWEQNPTDPHVIVWPFRATPESAAAYGAGQPTVIAFNGNLYQWYTDTTGPYSGLYLRLSKDAKNWSQAYTTNVHNTGSVDVKYDPVTQSLVMFEIGNFHQPNARLQIRTSKDGLTWTAPRVVCESGCFPHWSNNIGVSGDVRGALLGPYVLAAYGAPYDLNPSYNNDCKLAPEALCWGHWDLYGTFIDLRVAHGTADLVAIKKQKTGSRRTEVHELTQVSNYRNFSVHTPTVLGEVDGSWEFSFGDMNGDGYSDLVGIRKSATSSGRVEVHALSGANSYQTFVTHAATALATETGDVNQFELADWDRDGTPDLAYVKKEKTGSGYVEVHFLNAKSGFSAFSLHAVTPLSARSNFIFRFADWDHDSIPDLVAISEGRTASGRTEVHILSGASAYTHFIGHYATGLFQSSGKGYDFKVADANNDGIADLIIVAKKNTGSRSTEIHTLSGSDLGQGPFGTFIVHQATGLGEASADMDFLVLPGF